jgi:hypothetical protein
MSAYYSRRDYEREYSNGRGRGNHAATGTFCSLLTVLFIGLKLTHIIAWHWYWVVSPMWIPCVIYLLLAFIAGVLEAVAEHFARKARAAERDARMARNLGVKLPRGN